MIDVIMKLKADHLQNVSSSACFFSFFSSTSSLDHPGSGLQHPRYQKVEGREDLINEGLVLFLEQISISLMLALMMVKSLVSSLWISKQKVRNIDDTERQSSLTGISWRLIS